MVEGEPVAVSLSPYTPYIPVPSPYRYQGTYRSNPPRYTGTTRYGNYRGPGLTSIPIGKYQVVW